MMGKRLRNLLRPIRHPQSSGQAIIVLALGFIGLVGFVGIVTDVSLLLARYNTLSRAVDSAAISAAGQMRSDRSFAEVGLAARMMLELHGIRTDDVLVETCASTNETDPFLCSEQNRFRKLVRVGASIQSNTVFLSLLGVQAIELSAVSTSETAVLDIVLVLDSSESMLLDTTYEDWAKIGLGQVYVPPAIGTGYGGSSVFLRERAAGRFEDTDPGDLLYEDLFQYWGEELLGGVNSFPRVYPHTVNQRLDYVDAGGGTVPNDDPGAVNPNYRVTSFPYPGYGTQTHPREACRVRFWPYSVNIRIPQHIREISGFATYWEGNSPAQTADVTQTIFWNGFVPTYDFYGCCNDPTAGGQVASDYTLSALPGDTVDTTRGDFKFNDLICQPFKQARDATREFLDTVDFERGDRVAFVTYDRGAFLIDPDGANGRVAAGNSDVCPRDSEPDGAGRTTWTHMLASKCRAVRTLDQFVGVRADPNFYAWKENGGGWEAFAKGRRLDGTSMLVDYYHEGTSGGYDATSDRALNDYPVREFCPMQNAALPGFLSLYSLWDWDYTNPQYFGLSKPGLTRIMNPTWIDTEQKSYELWASCRNGNIGAGLREGNNALLDPQTTRRTGTVWVMIMMSDGAAGASDPVRLNGRKPLETEPYYDWVGAGLGRQTYMGIPDLLQYGRTGEYGAFGLCPLGFDGSPSQLTRDRAIIEFPFCSDEQPHTRHFCEPAFGDENNVGKNCVGTSTYSYGFAPGSYDQDYDCSIPLEDNLVLGRVYDVDVGSYYGETASTCDPYYDVDDYARDWADYVSLSRTGAGDEQLPTIFTISFGMNFRRINAIGNVNPNEDPASPAYVPHSAQYNTSDFLGEELLRYIADVGDNFQIDTDYQQDLKQDRTLDGVLTPPDRFGDRGPCEEELPAGSPPYSSGDVAARMGNGFSTRDGGNGTMVRPLPPRQDCGNYYNAPDQGRLQLVFDDIASRMFTRLAP